MIFSVGSVARHGNGQAAFPWRGRVHLVKRVGQMRAPVEADEERHFAAVQSDTLRQSAFAPGGRNQERKPSGSLWPVCMHLMRRELHNCVLWVTDRTGRWKGGCIFKPRLAGA